MNQPATPSLEPTPAQPDGFSISRILTALGPLLGLILIFVFFSMLNGSHFYALGNIRTILADSSIVAIAALGMTLVIISGGIDLSTGSVVAFSSVMCAKILREMVPGNSEMTFIAWVASFAVGIGFGMLCGFVNGLSIVCLRVVPFIATLGMMTVARGLAKWQANNMTVNVTYQYGSWASPYLPDGREWMLLPISVWITIVLSILAALILKRTVFGRHTVALGSSELTARLCGLRIGRLKLMIYSLAGALAGLSGVIYTSRLTQGDSSAAVALELNVIAAVVIGGGSLMGGQGSIVGTLAGALIISVLTNGATMAKWENYVQEMLVGLIIIFAVAFDQYRARKTAAS